MNLAEVQSVFGAVIPAPTIKKEGSIMPVILVLAVIGVGIWAYSESQK